MKQLFSFRKFFKSIIITLSGIREGIIRGQNIRFGIFYAILTIILSIIFSLNTIEFSIILICIGAVLSFELMNSQIEKILDIVKPEFNNKVRGIKDMSAGAVLIIAIVSLFVGVIIFLPHFLTLFKN